MPSQETLASLELVFSEVLGRSGIRLTETTTAQDVEGWDSLSHIDLISAAESRFRVRFSVREVQRLPNVGALADLIESKRKT